MNVHGWRDKVLQFVKFQHFSIWRGKPSPRAYCVRPYPFQRGTPPQRPQEPATLVERLNPPTRLLVPRTDHGSFKHSPALKTKTGTSRGIPTRPSFSDRANCLRDRLVAGPEPHGLPPPIGDSLRGAEVPPRLPWSPRHKALSSPLRPLRQSRVPPAPPNRFKSLLDSVTPP